MSPSGGDHRATNPWSKWAEVVLRLGPTTVAFLGLMWWLITQFDHRMIRVDTTLRDHHTQVEQHVSETRGAFERLDRLIQAQILITRQICVNTARTEHHQRACLQ